MVKYKIYSLRTLLAIVVMLNAAAASLATGSVSSALGKADTEVRASFEPISRIGYGVMAVIGVVGAISVFGKWTNGDPDTRKAAGNWFGALIFAGIIIFVLKAVFTV